MALVIALLGMTNLAWAQEEDDTYYGPWDPPLPTENNLGPIAGGEQAVANIQQETGGANGTEVGEITIFNDGTAIRVYSGVAKVEVIPTGSDGWTGSYSIESGKILFHPTGRPELECYAQESANWYGPCKLPEVAS